MFSWPQPDSACAAGDRLEASAATAAIGDRNLRIILYVSHGLRPSKNSSLACKTQSRRLGDAADEPRQLTVEAAAFVLRQEVTHCALSSMRFDHEAARMQARR